MTSNSANFPIWENDGEAVIDLNNLQRQQIENFINKVNSKEYRFVNNPCLCGNTDKNLDVVVAEKDRFGIPCVNVLCKKCGLIRLKDRLDDDSTAKFYMNEYRDIYVGQEDASDDFFNSQAQRGQTFLNLVASHVDMKEIESVFEIGCGAGGILYPFYQINKQISGCDFGEKYLKYGQDKGLNLYQGEINENNTPKNSQDLIILSHVMEHFNNPLETMSEIIEYIKSEKYLLVEVPGIFDIQATYGNPILYFQNAHVYNYYRYYLKVFFETLGLEVVYGDERCTFILRKPMNWKSRWKPKIFEKQMSIWAEKVAAELIHLQELYLHTKRAGITKRSMKENLEFSQLFNKIIEQLLQLKNNDNKYFIYGAGHMGQTIANLIPENIIGFIDNDPAKQATEIAGFKVFAPEYLNKIDKFDGIIISVMGREDVIVYTLMKDFKISKDKIFTFVLDHNQYVKTRTQNHKFYELLQKNKALKGIHKGKRCFLLGSGPSIKKEDLKPLKNEIVFALNNFYVHEDFAEIMGGDTPKYYVTAPTHRPQTRDEWREWFTDMEKYIPATTELILGLTEYVDNIKSIFEENDLFNKHRAYWYYPIVNFEENSFNKDQIDISKSIYAAETVSVYALIIAIYMGFDEIYLVGMDHDYFLYDNESEMRMYSKAIHQNDELNRTFGDSFYVEEFLRQYKIFSKYLTLKRNTDTKIYNASASGVLKIFERVKFANLF